MCFTDIEDLQTKKLVCNLRNSSDGVKRNNLQGMGLALTAIAETGMGIDKLNCYRELCNQRAWFLLTLQN